MPQTSAACCCRMRSRGCSQDGRAATPPPPELQLSDRAWTSARWASNTLTTSGCFWATAHMSAVWPRAARAFTFAPRASSCSTTSGLPERAATISGVSPRRSAAFGLAPAWSNRRTIAALPLRLAVHSGVAPRSFAALTLAPAFDQQVRALAIVAIARPVQCSRPVSLGRVDVGLLLHETANGVRVGVPGCVDQRVARWRRARDEDRQCDRVERRLQPAAENAVQPRSRTLRCGGTRAEAPALRANKEAPGITHPPACRVEACRCCRRSSPQARPACPSA